MHFRFEVRTWSLSTFLVLASVARCQSVPTTATHDEVEQWLRSSEPRMVSWGATFAASTADRDALPALESLAGNYKALPPQQYDPQGNYVPRTLDQKQQLDSMQAVLDALIQLHGTITSEGIRAILPDFSAQGLVLFATMPEPERSRFALAVYETRDTSDQPFNWRRSAQQQTIHMAAAILALYPPPGFTTTLLRETTIILKVAVTDDDRERDGWGTGGMCGDSLGLSPVPGWPQTFTYVVEQHWPSERRTETVLVAGVPDITSRRALSNSSCSTLPGFTSAQKLILAQQEAGIAFSAKRAGVLEYDTLRYTGSTEFPASLEALISRHRQPFLALTEILVSKGFVEVPESESATPRFELEIDDERGDKSQSLQVPRNLGPRTSINSYKPESGGFLKHE